MLFRLPPEQRLPEAMSLLASWNGAADSFRRAADMARTGVEPTPSLLEAAAELHDDLRYLVAELDTAVDRLAPGKPDFAEFLRARAIAVAISESMERSRDMLESAPPHLEHAPN
jgi:hypothetical protein